MADVDVSVIDVIQPIWDALRAKRPRLVYLTTMALPKDVRPDNGVPCALVTFSAGCITSVKNRK